MADHELSEDSDLLLEHDQDAADYACNAKRLKKAERKTCLSFAASLLALVLILFLLLHLSSPRHKSPPSKIVSNPLTENA